MTPLRSWTALFVLAPALVSTIACDGWNPASPSPPQPRTLAPQPPAAPTGFTRFQGVAMDADTDQPIAGARISTIQLASAGRYAAPQYPASTTAGSDGRFVLDARLPADWRDLMFEVDSPGYEKVGIYTNPAPGSETVLRAYRTITIQPGQRLDFRVYLGHYVCGFESYRCRRIVVDAAEGELVDLELIPADSRDVSGLLVGTSEPWPFSGYQPRVTAPAGPVWILGGGNAPSPGWLTLVATRR